VFDVGKSSAGQESCKPKSTALRDQRASLPVHLVNKAPKEQLDVRKPGHLRNICQHRPLLTASLTLPPVFAGESADSSPLVSGPKIGAIPMVVTGKYDPYLVALSILVAALASYTALDLGGRVAAARGLAFAYGWRRPLSQWGAAYGRCTSLPCSPSSCRHRCPTTSD
jgi:hypothetical protein